MAHQGQRVHRFATHQHVQLHQVRFAITSQVIIQRRVAARGALQAVVKIQNNFIERHLVGQHDPRGRKIFKRFLRAALFLAQLQDGPHRFFRSDDHRDDERFLDGRNLAGRREFRGIIHFHQVPRGGQDAVTHAGRRGDQVDVELALQALLHDLHVQQAQEAAAESKAQRGRGFRLVKKSRVVQAQFSQRVAQRLVIAGRDRIQPGEYHRLDGLEPRQRRSRTGHFGNRIAHPRVGHVLDVGHHKSYFARAEFVHRHRFGGEHADALHLKLLIVVAQPDFRARRHAPFHNPHLDHCAAVGIEPRIKNQRAQRRLRCSRRGRDPRNDSFQYIFHP